jgi:hypothetical protein
VQETIMKQATSEGLFHAGLLLGLFFDRED